MAKGDGKIFRRAQAKKQTIYQTAMRLFAARGYDNVSIDDIVREAKSSNRTFYTYFSSKDELLVFFGQELEGRFVDFYRQLLTAPRYGGENALEKLYIMCIYILHTLQQSGGAFIGISDSRPLRGEAGETAEQDIMLRCRDEIFLPLLRAGQEDGSIRADIGPEGAGLALYSLIKGTVFAWECAESPGDLVTENATLFELFCRGIAPADELDWGEDG